MVVIVQRMNLPLKSTFLFLALQSAVLAELETDDLWHSGSPESQGFSAVKLEALRTGLVAHNTKALLVIRNDTIVCEWNRSHPSALS